MAYNTKSVIRDRDGKPVPQYFNKGADQYEVVEGSGGAIKSILHNTSGAEIDIQTPLVNILAKLNILTGTVIDEQTRQANEADRIRTFNTNEQFRQNTFNANELDRQATILQFKNWYNNSKLTGRLPFIIDGGDFGDIVVGAMYSGGDF